MKEWRMYKEKRVKQNKRQKIINAVNPLMSRTKKTHNQNCIQPPPPPPLSVPVVFVLLDPPPPTPTTLPLRPTFRSACSMYEIDWHSKCRPGYKPQEQTQAINYKQRELISARETSHRHSNKDQNHLVTQSYLACE